MPMTAGRNAKKSRRRHLPTLARGLLFDPHWTQRAAAVLDAEAAGPPQYERAYQFRFLREKEQLWSRPDLKAAGD